MTDPADRKFDPTTATSGARPAAAPTSGTRGPAVPDLDIPPPRGSVPRMQAVTPPSGAGPAVPSLDLPPSSQRVPVARPPSSQRMQAVKPPAPLSDLSGDDEDFDMQIERDGASAMMMSPAAQSMTSQTRSPTSQNRIPLSAQTKSTRVAGTGLELSRQRSDLTPREEEDDGPSAAAKFGAWGGAGVLFAGAGFGAFKLLHRPGGIDLIRAMPHAFDGTSATESGVFSVASLVCAVVLGFGWLKLSPRPWVLLGSAAFMLLTSLAMVTVTLASTGENAAPPDGALLVPWLVPLSIACLALAMAGRASHQFLHWKLKRKAVGLPIAVVGGAVAVLAFELSRFAR